jgi:hypothetical protein
MQSVAIERTGSDRPSLFHTGARAGESGFLLRRQNAPAANRSESRNRLSIPGNYEFGAGLDFAYATGKSLVRFTQAYRLRHLGALGTSSDT